MWTMLKLLLKVRRDLGCDVRDEVNYSDVPASENTYIGRVGTNADIYAIFVSGYVAQEHCHSL